MRRTKIVCTLGPATHSRDAIKELIRAGMDVARLNFSHGTQAEHGEVIALIRQSAARLGQPVAVLQDLAGPKVRIGRIEAGSVILQAGALFTFTSRQVPGDQHLVSVTYPDLPKSLQPGDTLLLSDGTLDLEVLETTDTDVKCLVRIGGPLSSRKGINLPTRSIDLASLTDKDRDDLAFGIQQGVDYVALSFVRNASDMLEARRFIQERSSDIPLIAKIEKHEALNNMDE
ncbi:MAG: pyruvate kinase, partial [Acidobacteria bacterium]|nr:pyruvate kinase [Acidobacteriota bacterium]